jgi:hypothetical protein
MTIVVALGLWIAGVQAGAAAQGVTSPAIREQAEICLSCHADPSMSLSLPSGEQRPLSVTLDALTASVHGGKLACTDCHTDMEEIPHPERPPRSAREMRIAQADRCQRCHFANYTKTLDSVHQVALSRGDRMAPTCIDCHGSHAIRPPAQPRTHIAETCAQCHAGVAETYARSVHGRDQSNPDTPICTDCHRSHDVGGPRQDTWRLQIHTMCGSCHADKAKMAKYGLSTNVLQTYLADFHGATATLRSSVTALCTDCHGVHDIEERGAETSKVLRANLVRTCQRCHPEASDTFPDAWLSHYEPSMSRAPLVYAVRVFYVLLIPFMIGGLALQILLHLWRMVVNR